MPPVPLLSGHKVVQAFEALGWTVVRRGGSHIIMTKRGERATLSVPDHPTVARGTLRSLIRDANLTLAEFLAVL